MTKKVNQETLDQVVRQQLESLATLHSQYITSHGEYLQKKAEYDLELSPYLTEYQQREAEYKKGLEEFNKYLHDLATTTGQKSYLDGSIALQRRQRGVITDQVKFETFAKKRGFLQFPNKNTAEYGALVDLVVTHGRESLMVINTSEALSHATKKPSLDTGVILEEYFTQVSEDRILKVLTTLDIEQSFDARQKDSKDE